MRQTGIEPPLLMLCNWLHIALFLRELSLHGFSHIGFSTYKYWCYVLWILYALYLCLILISSITIFGLCVLVKGLKLLKFHNLLTTNSPLPPSQLFTSYPNMSFIALDIYSCKYIVLFLMSNISL